MDLSDYLKRSAAKGRNNNIPEIEKKCLNCSKVLTNKGSHLYYQRFCNEDCKDAYVKGGFD